MEARPELEGVSVEVVELPFRHTFLLTTMNIWKCQGDQHQCGKMIQESNIITPRCQVYLRDLKRVAEQTTRYPHWYQTIDATYGINMLKQIETKHSKQRQE